MGTRAARQAAESWRTLQADRQIPFTVTVASVGTPQVVWTPEQPNARFRVLGGIITSSTASVSASFKDGSAPSAFFVSGKMPANTPQPFSLGRGYLAGSATNNCRIDSDVPGVTFTGTILGREE